MPVTRVQGASYSVPPVDMAQLGVKVARQTRVAVLLTE